MAAFLCGPRSGGDDDLEIDEQPTQPSRLRDLTFDPSDMAETWPDLAAADALIKAAVMRTRSRPCPMCLWRRVVGDGEVVEIGPELPRLCEKHMRILCASSPADKVVMHQIYKYVYDWYHAPPEGDQYSD